MPAEGRNQPQPAVAALQQFITSHQTHTPAARRFGDKYDHYDPAQSNDRLLDHIESLLNPIKTRQPTVAQT